MISGAGILKHMFRTLLILFLAGFAAFRFTDISGASTLTSVILPLFDTLILIGLTLWLVAYFQNRGIDQNVPHSGSGSWWLGGGDGDGGGGSC